MTVTVAIPGNENVLESPVNTGPWAQASGIPRLSKDSSFLLGARGRTACGHAGLGVGKSGPPSANGSARTRRQPFLQRAVIPRRLASIFGRTQFPVNPFCSVGYRRFLGWVTLLALFISLTASCGAVSDSETAESSVTIAAMRPGTSWYVFAATLATLLQKDLPAGTNVEVIARGGGIGNPMLVDRGDATIAISQAATAAWAMNGHKLAYKGKKHENIRALVGGLNKVWVTVLLREEYIARTGNDTLQKTLTSQGPLRIVMKPAGSTVPVFADMVLESFGTSRAKIVANGGEVIQVSANQIAPILRDGRADLYFETAIQGHPTVTEIATTAKIRFIDLPDSVLERLRGPGVNPIPMPKYFKGQSGPTKAVDMGTVLIAHKDLPDDLAYRITKTVCENKQEMATAHKAWLDFVPEEGGKLEKTGIPLHPGAERYFREKGWL